jgi:NAD+ diphosphatase
MSQGSGVAKLKLPLSLPLAKSSLDRAAHHRGDEAELNELWQRARVVHFNGEKFLTDDAGLIFLTSTQVSQGERYFLGMDEAQTPYFLLHSNSSYGADESYRLLREANLDEMQIGLAVHGQSLALWHKRHPMCSNCGAKTQSALGGSVRRCGACEVEHYPRTDPAIIVLIRDTNDRILLGRQGVWPEHRFSTFAGFVEPGESFEAAVIREVHEEANLHVHSIEYVGSQPWPFPASLMIAFTAIIEDPQNAKPDGQEIVDIKWLDRNSIFEELKQEALLLPPPLSVARAMIEAWYAADGKERPALKSAETWR